MIKLIIKEIFIILLLIIAIGLVFCIVFYDYNTMNVTVPTQVQAYELPEETKTELEETVQAQEKQELVKTYIVDSRDLATYETSRDYEPGKVNPFAKYTPSPTTGNEIEGNNGNGGNNTNTDNGTGDTGKLFNTSGK